MNYSHINSSKILIFLLILIVTYSQAFNYDDSEADIKSKAKFNASLPIIRQKIIHKSLIGNWKLTQ